MDREKPERELGSRLVYAGRVINLRVDTVEVSGRIVGREVVEHRGAVAILPLTQSGDVVLIRQYRHAVGESLIEIPAGTLEPGETPEECARRELREETGMTAERLDPICSFYLAPGYSSELLHLFVAQVGPAVGQRLDKDESIEVLVKPLGEAIHMAERGEIRDAKTLIGLLLAERGGVGRNKLE